MKYAPILFAIPMAWIIIRLIDTFIRWNQARKIRESEVSLARLKVERERVEIAASAIRQFNVDHGQAAAIINAVTGDAMTISGAGITRESLEMPIENPFQVNPEIPRIAHTGNGPENSRIDFGNTPDVLEMLRSEDRIWIIGGEDYGKTTLLRTLAARWAQRERVMVIDSHDHAGKWGALQVVGTGRKYHKIEGALRWILNEFNRRYEIYSGLENPESEFETIRIISDEWTKIPRKMPKTMDEFTDSFFTEGRKIGFKWAFASHSDRVGKTGFTGMKDIFDRIMRVELLPGYRAELKKLGESRIYQLPDLSNQSRTLRPKEDRIYKALREGPKTRSEVSRLFSGNVAANSLDTHISNLIDFGMVRETKKTKKRGRPETVYEAEIVE